MDKLCFILSPLTLKQIMNFVSMKKFLMYLKKIKENNVTSYECVILTKNEGELNTSATLNRKIKKIKLDYL